VTTPPPQPWERQPGETTPAWHAFVTYRDLGFHRSILKTQHALEAAKPAATKKRPASTKPATKPPTRQHRHGHLTDWSVKHRWVERAAAWDAELDRRNIEAKLNAIDRHNQDMEQVGRDVLTLAKARLRGVRDTDGTMKVTPIDPGKINAYQLMEFIRTGDAAIRASHGRPLDGVRGAIAISPRDVQTLLKDIAELTEGLLDETMYQRWLERLWLYLNGPEITSPGITLDSHPSVIEQETA
jgi:hypothetical protein